MKQLTIALTITLLTLAGCKKEDEGPKIITELHGGLYEDGTWTPMALRKVSLMIAESNYPLPPTLTEMASTYTGDDGKYHFKNIDFQSHERYYLYFHFDKSKYYEHSTMDHPVYIYSNTELVHLLTGRAKVKVSIKTKENETYFVNSSRDNASIHYNTRYSEDVLQCEALKKDTITVSILKVNNSFIEKKYAFYTYIHDTAFLEINF